MARDPQSKRVNRRRFIQAGAATALTAVAAPALAAANIRVAGKLVQGGFALGRTEPRAKIFVNGQVMGQASAAGLYIVGFDRDEHPSYDLATTGRNGRAEQMLTIAPTKFDVQRVDGLAADQVNRTDPALLARIKHEAELKHVGFSSMVDGDWFKDGFVYPLEHFRVSGRFGNQRVLNGTPKPPHYGFDMAAPTGTPIHAPAPGVITLAEPNMHFDGGITLIDHGQGLISVYLHQSKQVVRKGDFVQRGQWIGNVGMTGRATGPHLCWRLHWRNRNLDPSLLVGGRSPA